MAEPVSIIPTPAAVDVAWDRYRSLVAPVINRPTLLLDRAYHVRVIRAEAVFKRAFLASDRGGAGTQ